MPSDVSVVTPWSKRFRLRANRAWCWARWGFLGAALLWTTAAFYRQQAMSMALHEQQAVIFATAALELRADSLWVEITRLRSHRPTIEAVLARVQATADSLP